MIKNQRNRIEKLLQDTLVCAMAWASVYYTNECFNLFNTDTLWIVQLLVSVITVDLVRRKLFNEN